MKLKIILLSLIALLFSGCIVGTVVALPFKAVGAVTNVIAPDVVGDSISGVGTVIDTAIPF